jgi:hypothetical protein
MNGVQFWMAVVQCAFTLGWTVYVIFLPGLLQRAGLPADWLPWILIVDQLLFAAADYACGSALDRVERGVARLGIWLAMVVLLSGSLFALLPFAAGTVPKGVFLSLLLLWVVSASVLRVPPLVLLAKHVSPGEGVQPIGAYLFGLGVAGALAPYLTVALKRIDPAVPFAVASLVLALATAVLVWRARDLPPVDAAAATPTALGVPGRAGFFLLAVALFAAGIQVHAAINSALQFRAIAPSVPLEYLMPIFWGAFSIAMFPASLWVGERGPTQALMAGGALGAVALFVCLVAGSLPLLVAGQLLAGAAWAAVFVAVLTCAGALGRTGREGRWLGLTFALFAVAVVMRIGIALAAADGSAVRSALPWVALALWALGAAATIRAMRR